LLIAFWPASKRPDDAEPAAQVHDAFAGGFPVPPLPGQLPAGTLEQREVTSARE
jgi:hypothetical protein